MQVRYQYLFSNRDNDVLTKLEGQRSNVAIQLQWKTPDDVAKTRLCKVLLGCSQMRCSDDVVFEIQSDFSIVPICKGQSEVKYQLQKNVSNCTYHPKTQSWNSFKNRTKLLTSLNRLQKTSIFSTIKENLLLHYGKFWPFTFAVKM